MGTKVTCPQMETGNPEMLCAYAALLLADGGVVVTADNINTVVSAAGGKVPAYYAALFEKVNAQCPVTEMVEKGSKVGSGGGGAPAAAAKEESEEEEDIPAAGGLFDAGDDY